MVSEKESDLLCLVEVMSKELFSIGLACHEVRWAVRLKLRDHTNPPNIIREYDEILRKTVDRIGNVIGLAEERTSELVAR